MKYIKYKNHSEYSEYTVDDLRTLLDPSAEFPIVNLSEENNSVDLLYNAPRFTVMRENNGNPENVNDTELIACFNVDTTKMDLLSDYDKLPSEEYYVINDLYVLKNSGFNKQQDKMDNFFIKYPGHYPVGVDDFSEITNFVLEPYSVDDTGATAKATSCKIHMNWDNRDNADKGASDIDTHVFVYKKNENNNLVLQNGYNSEGYGIDGHIYYPSHHNYFSNDDIEVALSWDDRNSGENAGKGEYIKIKQKCADAEYAKYYFVYVLYIFTGSSNHKAIWDNVKISITNNMYFKTDYIIDTETINTETNQRAWGGFMINNDNVLVQKNMFYSDVDKLIKTEDFKNWTYIVTSGQGSSLPGMEIQITLPEINIDITEDEKSY